MVNENGIDWVQQNAPFGNQKGLYQNSAQKVAKTIGFRRLFYAKKRAEMV
ncbi:hypothetical protein [Desulfosporosinus fructosivorans]